jgi:hypothetical protein
MDHLQKVYISSDRAGVAFEGYEFKSSLNSCRVFVIFTREYSDNDEAFANCQGCWVDTDDVETYTYI